MTQALQVSLSLLWTAYINDQNKDIALRRFLILHQQELNEDGIWDSVKKYIDEMRDVYYDDTGVKITFWDYDTIQLAHSSLINNDVEMFEYSIKGLS